MNSPDSDGNRNPEGVALSDKSNPSWIVCQLGAREHYSIPRALSRLHVSSHLITDYWHSRKSISFTPPKLQERFHSDIAEQAVSAFNSGIIRFELAAKSTRPTEWRKIIQRNQWFSAVAARKLERMLSQTRKRPVVFSYSYTARDVFQVARKYGCPTLLGQIDPGPEEMKLVQDLCERAGMQKDATPPEEYWENWREECRLADGLIVNSEWSKELLQTGGLPESKLHVVPLVHERARTTTDSSRSVPQQFTINRPLRVLFLGQVIVRKGAIELIDAIAQTTHLPIEWTIVGGGNSELLDRLRTLTRTHASNASQNQEKQTLSRVHVTGSVPRGSTSTYYQNADVFILPTHSDGYALTQLEAASWGLPIIASRFCGNVVNHEVNGLILDEVTGRSIAEAVSQLCRDPQLLHLLKSNQQKHEFCTLADLGSELLNVEKSLRQQGEFTSPALQRQM